MTLQLPTVAGTACRSLGEIPNKFFNKEKNNDIIDSLAKLACGILKIYQLPGNPGISEFFSNVEGNLGEVIGVYKAIKVFPRFEKLYKNDVFNKTYQMFSERTVKQWTKDDLSSISLAITGIFDAVFYGLSLLGTKVKHVARDVSYGLGYAIAGSARNDKRSDTQAKLENVKDRFTYLKDEDMDSLKQLLLKNCDAKIAKYENDKAKQAKWEARKETISKFESDKRVNDYVTAKKVNWAKKAWDLQENVNQSKLNIAFRVVRIVALVLPYTAYQREAAYSAVAAGVLGLVS